MSVGSLLDISKRALSVQSQAIRTIGDNIANVNTPGYSRRRAELVTTQSTGLENLRTGSGVAVQRIVRQVDDFINREYAVRISTRSQGEARSEYLGRAEAPFSLEGTVGQIGYEMTQFFASLQDLATNPADISLRNAVIQRGQSLTASIGDTYGQLADLQREADGRIGYLIEQVNTLSGQIADLNGKIAIGETTSQENLTLRDQRDEAIRQLSELLPVQTVETGERTVNVVLPNGFSLVKGANAVEIEFDPNPSFAPSGGFPAGLDGQALGHIVYDFDSSSSDAHIDLTNLIAGAGGEIGGLLQFRGVQSTSDTSSFDAVGDIVDIAARVEAISRDLLTRFNLSYLGPDETTGGLYQGSSGSLNDINVAYTATSAFGLFTFSGASDADGDGQPELADLNTLGFDNYSSILQFAISDPRELAAALDLNSTAGSTSFAPGDASNINRLLAERQTATNYSVGSYQVSGAYIDDVYNETVGFVGSLSARAQSDASSYAAREEQIKNLQQSISGVSLDDEFAQLINFQRAFEGAARMVRVGDQLLEEIINLI